MIVLMRGTGFDGGPGPTPQELFAAYVEDVVQPAVAADVWAYRAFDRQQDVVLSGDSGQGVEVSIRWGDD